MRFESHGAFLSNLFAMIFPPNFLFKRNFDQRKLRYEIR